MDELASLYKTVAAWAIGALLSVVVLYLNFRLNKQKERQDRMEAQMDDLNKRMVTSEQFMHAITEIRNDRRQMHEDNQISIARLEKMSETHMTRIEKKMDEYERRDSETRHQIANGVQVVMREVQAVSSKVSVLEALRDKNARTRRDD